MAIALAEAEKYEILERIGNSRHMIALLAFVILTSSIGCGSFGIIRKVKRKSDGFVSPSETVSLLTMNGC